MQLPPLDHPARYGGLYVFDFGAWTAVGYTTEEIAMLLESEQYRDGRVYRIVRAAPNGRMELQGVHNDRFHLESGMFFWRGDLPAAHADFDSLRRSAADAPPPCRCFAHLADRGPEAGPTRFVVALIYGAEHEADMGAWLDRIDYRGGDTVEGGISRVTNYYEQPRRVLDRAQFHATPSAASRTREEVFSQVRRAVQR